MASLTIGTLGSAATDLFDTIKVSAGGKSRAGFGYIKQVISRTVPARNRHWPHHRGYIYFTLCLQTDLTEWKRVPRRLSPNPSSVSAV
jgi:hypothetical protein